MKRRGRGRRKGGDGAPATTPSGRGLRVSADSEGGGSDAQDDGDDMPADPDVGREARRPRRPAHPAHPGHDSAHLPIRAASPYPTSVPHARPDAVTDTTGARPPERRRGRRDEVDVGYGPRGQEHLFYAPSMPMPLAGGRASSPHAPPLPTVSPSEPGVLDYQKYRRGNRIQIPERKIGSFTPTSEPGQRIMGDNGQKAWWRRRGGGRGRGGGGGRGRGGVEGALDQPQEREVLLKQAEGLEDHLSPSNSRRNGGRKRGRGRGRGTNQERTLLPPSSSSSKGRKEGAWSEVSLRPRGHPKTHISEGETISPRERDYLGRVNKYAQETGRIPDFNCRPDKWDECERRKSGRNATSDVLVGALGKGGQDHVMREDHEGLNPETYRNEDYWFRGVTILNSMTSTGNHKQILVLYTSHWYTGITYKLSLNTHNTHTNRTGTAKQLISFSKAPTLEKCDVKPLVNGTRFLASCENVWGQYFPVYLQFAYHFLRYDTKIVFYHGTRTSFAFSLPSGLSSNDHRVYVSVRAVDGKGVASKYQEIKTLTVRPLSDSGDGVLPFFREISRLENESPPLLLQEIRALAWELNLLETVTETVLDNILAIFFYQSCKESWETVTGPSQPVQGPGHKETGILAKVNLLKSCARDHLAEMVAELPIRDEMEVLQVITTLEVILAAEEYISSKTFTRVIDTMRTAARKMWWNYNPEIRTEAAKEFFLLTSEVLEKQTEIYDWASSSVPLSMEVESLLLGVMEGEIRMRFLEERPLVYTTSNLKYHGYLAEGENLNKWNSSVLFLFLFETSDDGLTGGHLVQSLVHERSPFNIENDPIVSKVINIDLHTPKNYPKLIRVTLPRSKLATDSDFDFRRPGILVPQSLSVYEFEVRQEHAALAFHVNLQIVRILNTDYPVAAVILICENMQSLREPLYKEELPATLEASQVKLFVPPGQLSRGNKLLIIMDKNSYENNWPRHNVTVNGADIRVGAWWSQCLSWDTSKWTPDGCSVEGNLTNWDVTTCRCKTNNTIYGSKALPILTEESIIAVNDLMLVETYVALYFIVLVLVLYFVLALGLLTAERHRLRRRNIWLRDNRPGHEWAYLLTIKTGTQWNAGTTSKVYAILHGTHGMSETRELQSKQTGQLFTRGALCTFILTTSEPLGDILKVQLWHDNSGGRSAGWYVCETSVVDLVLGARYAYPCYRWLSVQAEDAKVEREVTLESPTTFFQDFEHFLPQYASEHMLWTSLLTTSSTAKFYRLQRLTICLIVCLCLGTISLGVVQRINTEHTMMVPDMHIEPLYYGCIIAAALLPVQWLLEMVFKMSNRLEEKEYNNKSVLETLRATKENQEASAPPRGDDDENQDDEGDEGSLSDDDSELYNPNSNTWASLTRWAQSVELTNAHLNVFQEKDLEGMHVTQRARTPAADLPTEEVMTPAEHPRHFAEVKGQVADVEDPEDTKKCSSSFVGFLTEIRRAFHCLVTFVAGGTSSKCARGGSEDEEAWETEEEEEEEEDEENNNMKVASSLTFIFSQCVGWIVCCFFAAMCCMMLVVKGAGMPMDYCALWLHIIYITLCYSMFVMQPLVVVIYTLYKVCMYRWLGCRGCISDCVTVPLDQVVAIWNRYQTVLLGYENKAEDLNNEKLLEERQRTRDLRFAHPPSEDYLLSCREKEMQQEKVSSLFRSIVGLSLLQALLIIIASHSNISERYMLNASVHQALVNGTCLDREKFHHPGQDVDYNTSSAQKENEDYMPFRSILTKEDWWKWASSELIALTYNFDRNFSEFNIFCDTNSVLIGRPRLRKYDNNPQECEAAKYLLHSNLSLADLLRVKTCFPEYVDNVTHVFGFGSNLDKEYEWDAHFLAVNYGVFSQYSYTHHQQDLPSSQRIAGLWLIFLELGNWIDENATRAVVTEFTLYHPQTDVYTTVNLLAEFPSLSGAQMTTRVSSTAVVRYRGTWTYVCMLAEVILLAVAMHYLYRATIYVYKSHLKIWKSFWGLLDICMTVLSWSYIVCLMLRVHIAEDVMWQLRVAYFQKFVNLKGLTTWDDILESLIGGMLLVHTIRCMRMLRYLPLFRRLGLVLNSASKDVLVVTVMLCGILVCCMFLGYMWFSPLLWEFHTILESFLTLVSILMTHVPFFSMLESQTSGYYTFLGYLYYLITYILLYQLTRALFKAAFIHAKKSYVNKPGVDIAWKDIQMYAKERGQSLLRTIQRKEETVDEPTDNTPPDFYMAELELQINQILSGLDNLAESLGIVMDRADKLGEESDDESNDEVYRDSHDDGDDDGSDQGSPDRKREWQLEEDFLRGGVKSSTLKTELEARLQPLQRKVQALVAQTEAEEQDTLDERQELESVQDSPFDLDAFTDIASCHTELEAIARSWNLSESPIATKTWTQDDGGQLAKFLKDVSVSAASDESLQTFSKYGKTVGKIKLSSKLHPSHESLATSLRNQSATSDSSRLRSVSSFAEHGGPLQEPFGARARSHTSAAPNGPQDSPTHGSSVAMQGSRLRRTQTQGRGKGHVDVLDIESLILDSEDGSEV